MITVHMTINNKYFQQILSNEKKEEYREIKPYWEKRLSKHFTHILFQNGYSSNSPKILVEKKYVNKIKIIHEHFGDKEIHVFAIGLGKITLI